MSTQTLLQAVRDQITYKTVSRDLQELTEEIHDMKNHRADRILEERQNSALHRDRENALYIIYKGLQGSRQKNVVPLAEVAREVEHERYKGVFSGAEEAFMEEAKRHIAMLHTGKTSVQHLLWVATLVKVARSWEFTIKDITDAITPEGARTQIQEELDDAYNVLARMSKAHELA